MVQIGEVSVKMIGLLSTLKQAKRVETQDAKVEYAKASEDQQFWKEREAMIIYASSVAAFLAKASGVAVPQLDQAVAPNYLATFSYENLSEMLKTIGLGVDGIGAAGKAMAEAPAIRASAQANFAFQVKLQGATDDKRSTSDFIQQLLQHVQEFNRLQARAYGVG